MAVMFAILWVVTSGLLICALWAISTAREQTLEEKNIHEKCHEATLAVLTTASRRTDASALRAAADRWDSIEEQARITRLVRDQYVPGDGTSVPALWLRAEADRMDPAIEADEGIHA